MVLKHELEDEEAKEKRDPALLIEHEKWELFNEICSNWKSVPGDRGEDESVLRKAIEKSGEELFMKVLLLQGPKSVLDTILSIQPNVKLTLNWSG